MKKIFLLAAIILHVIPEVCISAISFIDGKYETTFDCSEWTQGESLNCDNLSAGGSWTCDDSNGSYGDEITYSANYPLGGGGLGQRHYYAAPKNNHSGGTSFDFPSTQNELWMRWYQKANSGLTGGLSQGETKTLYFRTSEGNSLTFGMIYGDQWGFWAMSPDLKADRYNSVLGYGWNSLVNKHNWVAVEIHIKADTNNSNGILQAWVNGDFNTRAH